MTERSILAGKSPQIVIHAGGDVLVKGWDSERVLAESSGIWGLQIKRKNGVIEVQIGGSGQALVPFDSSVKVYSGKSSEIQEIRGVVSAVAGLDVRISQSNVLAQASAGKAMDIDCRVTEGPELKLTAGWHLRCWLRDVKNVKYLIDDLGGKWQTVLGDGSVVIHLKAGGDVTLVTDQPVTGLSPDGLMGKVVAPGQ